MKIFILFIFLLITETVCSQIDFTDSIPVRIKSIDGERINSVNRITWSVACFLSFANFEIQRSDDGVNYTTLYNFQADETRCREPFDYTDPRSSSRSFYRIRAGDIDGKFYSSKIIALYGRATEFDITAITPSLILSTATLNVSSALNESIEILITSSQGLPVHRQKEILSKGNNSIPLSLSALSAGSYILTIINSKSLIRSARFIKV